MFTRPIGVQQKVSQGGPQILVPVFPVHFKLFCLKSAADSLCKELNDQLGLQLQVIEDGEAGLVYVFDLSDAAATPRIWSLVGQDASGNEINENAGWIIDRKVRPIIGIDKFVANSGRTPEPAFDVFYGIAQFKWA